MLRRIALVLFVLGLIAVPVVVQGTPALAAGVKCQQESVPVNLSASDPTVYQIAGWACWQGTQSRKPVEVLVPGFTYDHTYWDFPYAHPSYSYVQAAAAAGYVSFAIDRLGTGKS